MATKTATNPKWIMSDRGDDATMAVAYVLHHTATHYHAGEFLRVNSSGLIVQCTTSASSEGAAANAITHYALRTQDAIGNSTTQKSVGVVHEDDIWEINENDTTVARANIGQHYGMNVTSNLCTIDLSNAYGVFEVINPVWAEQPYQNSSADTLALVTVKVLGIAINVAPTT